MPEKYPMVFSIVCVNSINAVLKSGMPNKPITPPFFRAKETPIAAKRVEKALLGYMPVMLFNTMKFEGAPIDEELINIISLLEQNYVSLCKKNPWVKLLIKSADMGIPTTELESRYSDYELMNLNLARPAFEVAIDQQIRDLQNWFLKNWEGHKEWLSKI